MSFSTVLLIVIVAFFAFLGYRKGLFNSIAKISSVIAGYAVAIFYIEPGSVLFESWFALKGIVAFVAASAGLFFTAFLVVRLFFWFVRKLYLKEEKVSTASAIGGALIGSVVGTVVAIVLVWTLTFVSEMRPVAAGQVVTQNKSEGMIEDLAKQAVSKLINLAMLSANVRPEVSQFSLALIETPGEVSQQVQRLTKSGELSALFSDRDNQSVLNSGDAEALQQLPAFQALVNNPDMLALAKSAGMLGETGDNVALAEATLATQTTDAWLRVQQVKNNSRVQEIMSDPEFTVKLQSANPIDLLTNPQLLELANIIFEDKSEASKAAEPEQATQLIATEEGVAVEKKKSKIYSWKDDQGRIHYSDTDPKLDP